MTEERAESLERIAIELCRGYGKRKLVIEERKQPETVIDFCEFYNDAIKEAVAQNFHADPRVQEIMIREIGERKAWEYTQTYLGRDTYYKIKNRIRLDICRNLHLI